ncbi:hypothetical protein HQP08_23705 [Rhodococcus fascians]|jgi:hypothetical protein|uniref:hypothetical protein n=2 Tax=Mycobacteriales TaxID=85007 RepID=UPI00068E6985|nr:hypothetical protein [Rhodococcus fascians]AMY53926.1 hypothetical protein A3L23_02589 [Rhodococcus fascians D188]OZD58142.1 hypothetical protein CH268_19785 [Rhodococcus sp. 06-1460-1B]MBM7245410.1 hypothetical protein [Rhodococcus fascians]MBY3870927.1 hypothetical protein [Rhodococcus fascians]MBY3911584.1 hypothetical protein [Rhodococcus fascians]
MTSNRKLVGAALAIAVTVLALGSVQSTAALWRTDATVPGTGPVNTGTLVLTAGSGGSTQSTSFQFDELKPSGLIQTGDFVQRPLIIANGGTIPLKFRLGTVGVPSSSAGIATVHVDARRVESTADCPTTGSVPGGVATLADVSVQTKGSASGVAGWTNIPRNTSATVCIRSTLLVAPAAAVAYRHVFTFDAQQLKNNP